MHIIPRRPRRFRCYVYWSPTAQNRDVAFPRTLLSGLSAAAINGKRVLSRRALLLAEKVYAGRNIILPVNRKNVRGKTRRNPTFAARILHARSTEDPRREDPPPTSTSSEARVNRIKNSSAFIGRPSMSRYYEYQSACKDCICTHRYTHVQNFGESLVGRDWILIIGSGWPDCLNGGFLVLDNLSWRSSTIDATINDRSHVRGWLMMPRCPLKR